MPNDVAAGRVGLRVPAIFYGTDGSPEAFAGLRQLLDAAGDTSHPYNPWFVADNLLTYAHSAGFLTEPRFVAAVLASRPQPAELSIAWRTHTLCWAAESSLNVEGAFVECGSYEGYSMEVVLRYLGGIAQRTCWLYDVFDPQPEPGVGKRMQNHAPDLFDRVRTRFAGLSNVTVTRGKVPGVLAGNAPDRIAFLHIDMNNVAAEIGALEVLFDRVSPGGIIVFDDYGWSAYRDQKDAEDVFMRERGLSILELPTGQGLVIKR